MASSIKRIILAHVPCILALLGVVGCGDPAQRREAELTQAQTAFDAGAFEQAVNVLEPLSEEAPENVEIKQLLGLGYRELGDHLGAAIILRDCYLLDPARIHLAKDAAESFAKIGDHHSAILAYRDYLEIFKDDALAMRGLADSLLATGQDSAAIQWLILVEKNAPPLFTRDYILETGRIYRLRGLPIQARRYYERLDTDDDISYSLPAQLALIEFSASDQDWEQVEARIATLDSMAPGAFDSSPVAYLREQLEQRAEARARLEAEALRQQQAADEAQANLIAASQAEPTPEPAADPSEPEPELEAPTEEISSSIPEAPESPATRPSTDAEIVASEDPAAETTISEVPTIAAETEPEPTPQPGTLVKDDTAPISDEPDTRDAPIAAEPNQASLIAAGDAALAAGNFDLAINTYYDADALAPGTPVIWERIAQVYIEQESLRQAEIAMLEAMRHAPEDAELRVRYIRIIQGMGDSQKLMRTIQSAKQRFPDHPQITLLLARAFDRIERNERVARFYYQQFLDLAPQAPQADAVRERLLGR